jgi:hypothetical protein
MRRSREADALNARQRAFADAWAGIGTGVAAAREAGYTGDGRALKVTASKLLRHPGVRARIAARLGDGVLEQATVEAPATTPARRSVPPGGLVKGRGRGTATERVELLMGIARDKKLTPKERIAAVLAAAELEGERGRGRIDPPRAAPVLPPMPSDRDDPAPRRAHPALALVMNDEDAHGG